MDDERLQDSSLSDVDCEFFERVVGELGARVLSILVKQRHGQEQWHAIVAADLDGSGCIRSRFGPRRERSRRRLYGLMKRGRPWLRIEQVELNLFGLVPRQAHVRIVPLPIEARKSPLNLAS